MQRMNVCPDSQRRQSGFTLVELLTVIAIIGVLAALALPAINVARSTSRRATCANNLRQFGIGLSSRASNKGSFCSGAYDWQRDGSVTEVGWVADLVNAEVLVGQMLCPANPNRISEAYNQLLSLDPATFDDCVERLGSEAITAPDGTRIVNACRRIAESGSAPDSEARRLLVEEHVFDFDYNTNFACSWILARSEPLLDSSGNVRANRRGCQAHLLSRGSCFGPLTLRQVDAARTPSSAIPLLGDAAAGGSLLQTIGSNPSGMLTTRSMTRGPVLKSNMQYPAFSSGTSKFGPDGWWATWNRNVLQDYRAFLPVHRGSCNVLFADGGVRAVEDSNGDGLLNNGFESASGGGFTDAEVELPPGEFTSLYSLQATRLE